jgi:hypothetical protein
VLIGHTKIASVAEPWVILNHLPTSQGDIARTRYGPKVSGIAHAEFVESIGGEHEYYETLQDFFSTLYQKACPKAEAQFFIDKTPRYYFILSEIKKIFPEAKFIFLYRNPLAVVSSIINTWSAGDFRRLYRFKYDMYSAPELLVKGAREYCDQALVVNYEQFVISPEVQLRRIFEYLGIEGGVSELSQGGLPQLAGSMGDKTGVLDYTTISPASLERWKAVFNTPYRNAWARRYLQRLGPEVLSGMGYSDSDLLEQLTNIPLERRNAYMDRVSRIYSHWMLYYSRDNPFRKFMSFLLAKDYYPYY